VKISEVKIVEAKIVQVKISEQAASRRRRLLAIAILRERMSARRKSGKPMPS